jgi:hypothetical protein
MARELELRRFVDNGEATAGFLIEKKPYPAFLGYTLEDQAQAKKVMKETRIPAGRYRLVLNRSTVPTPKTEQYRKKYPWFKWHIMLLDVKGFSGIYIHIGNDDDDTDGCILLGDVIDNIMLRRATPLTQSTNAFERFYKKYYPILENENTEPVYLTVVDEQY